MLRGRLTRSLLLSLAGLATALVLLTSPAQATSFGIALGTAPFNVAPSYPYDCSVVVSPFLGPVPLTSDTGQPASSCIWIHVPTPAEVQAFGGANISLEPPRTGTVTQVHVGVGATTGPMQVVVMRSLYENTATPGSPNDACCLPVARSQIFTPTANSITTVNVNLPVREDATPPPQDTTTIADFDTLGLAVLQPGVPVPLYYTGDPSAPVDFVWSTATPSTVTPGFSTDTGGFFVALSGEWTAAGGGGGGGGGGLPIGFGNRVENVRHGNANVGLQCARSVACVGQLLLQNQRAPGAQLASAHAAGKLVTYGRASFKLVAHGHKLVAVKLSTAAKRLVAKHRSTKVWANVKLSGGSKYALPVTLRR